MAAVTVMWVSLSFAYMGCCCHGIIGQVTCSGGGGIGDRVALQVDSVWLVEESQ